MHKKEGMQLTDADNKINMKDILNLENALELELPTEYKEFLLKNNGGYVSEFLCTPDFMEISSLRITNYMMKMDFML